jgi:hypothetical protein
MESRLPESYSRYKDQSIDVRVATLRQLRSAGYTWKEISAMVGASESVVQRNWREGIKEFFGPKSRRIITIGEILEAKAKCWRSGREDFLKSPKGNPPEESRGTSVTQAEANAAALRAYGAWRTCLSCPVKAECLEMVDPQASGFDGVAGGKMWANGRDVTEEVTRRVFVFKHQRANPRGCADESCVICRRRVRSKA